MPHGLVNHYPQNVNAIIEGLEIHKSELFFIVPIGYEYDYNFNENEAFSISLFCGTKKSCEKHLILYPNCKIV